MGKKITIGIIGIIAVILIIPIFLKSTFSVERSVVISKPPATVYKIVCDYGTWKNWSVWAMKDVSQKMTITGAPCQLGHTQEWDGQINGKGRQTITSLLPDQEIVFSLEFLEPNPMKSTAKMKFEEVSGGTKVTWSNTGDLEYPVGRYFGPFLDGLVGPDFEGGLQNLKALVEK